MWEWRTIARSPMVWGPTLSGPVDCGPARPVAVGDPPCPAVAKASSGMGPPTAPPPGRGGFGSRMAYGEEVQGRVEIFFPPTEVRARDGWRGAGVEALG